MLISWILNTVSDKISNGMNFINTDQKVCEELNDQFYSVNGYRVYQVLKDYRVYQVLKDLHSCME